jgi:hypothetical protein
MKAPAQMTTTNIRLPKTHLKALKRVAVEREQTSLGSCATSPSAYRRDPLFALGTKPGRSGIGDLAEHHNRYLDGSDR